MAATTTVPVRLGPRSYEVSIGRGVLGSVGDVLTRVVESVPRRAVLVCDCGVPSPVSAAAETSLIARSIAPLRFPFAPGEDRKTLESLGGLLAFMAEHRLERTDAVIALGGGIVGDLAGFAAATYRRGIPFVQCPTTLLAMVDASVGGKTAVNLLAADGALLKNAAGAFHQPRAVLVDLETLLSLPDRTYRAGLAECVKHSMIAGDFNDAALADWTEANRQPILARDPGALATLIARNVAIKAAVVERDEREEAADAGRALLNLGHTFAHAIETIRTLSPDGDPGHAPLHHGEAVALGLIAAARAAEIATNGSPTLTAQTKRTLAAFGLPTSIAGLRALGLRRER